MSLVLHMHPLSSFCWKTLIALYENATPFEPLLVNPGEETSREAFRKIWPIGKFPVLRDNAPGGNNGRTIPESTIIIEYLDQHYPGPTRFIPADADLARDTRLRDRFFDHYIHHPMQQIIANRLRPADKKDPYGVEQARGTLRTALDMTEQEITGKTWAMGDMFTLADCAAAPALYYANRVMPFADTHPGVTAYLQRLMQRPAFARTLQEAEPFFKYFPTE